MRTMMWKNVVETEVHHDSPHEVEISNIHKFLTLPMIPTPIVQRQNTSTPIIDHLKSWIMTNAEYLK